MWNLFFYANQSIYRPNHIEMAFNYVQFWLFQVHPIAQFKPDKPKNLNFKSETRLTETQTLLENFSQKQNPNPKNS